MLKQEYVYPSRRFVHHLDANQIANIIQSSPWKTLDQSVTSAETNNDDQLEPSNSRDNTSGVDAFADLSFDQNVKTILDVGGGKFDACTDFMKKKNIKLLTWDPYNRPLAHNTHIEQEITEHKADAATSMSVLNVIPEIESRLAHITTLKAGLKENGMAYIKIWPGEGRLRGSNAPTLNSYGHPGYQANAYVSQFLREVQIVFGIRQVKLHESIPNLIVAKKTSEMPTSLEEIKRIIELSKKDSWLHWGRRPSFFKAGQSAIISLPTSSYSPR